MKVTTSKINSETVIIPTRPGIQLSNCKKGGVGKTLLSKLKAAYCLESGLDFYALDADRQESFLKAYPEFALPTRFSELDKNLKIPDRILDLALEKLVLVDLPGNVEEAFNHWLTDNQYFLENELFDFYFSVAQNLAAVEVLGASGDKILKAKEELEQSAQAYATQLSETSTQMTRQLESQLSAVRERQDRLERKLNEVLEGLATEHQNLHAISTGLVNSTAALLAKQKQMLVQTEAARKFAHHSVILAWIIPVAALLGWGVMLLLSLF